MSDYPEYDLVEFILAGIFIAASASAFVWFIAGILSPGWPQVAEGAGLCLMFLGGAAHPKKFVADYITFPVSLAKSTGRETPITVLAAWMGTSLWIGTVILSYIGAP